MFVCSVTLLAMLAMAASIEYETTVSEGLLPDLGDLYTLGPYHIPEGQCSARLDLRDKCGGDGSLGVNGIRRMVATVTDQAPFPSVVFSSRKSRFPHNLFNTITVHRQKPCNGVAKLDVKIQCVSAKYQR